jgi:hypothetical protein
MFSNKHFIESTFAKTYMLSKVRHRFTFCHLMESSINDITQVLHSLLLSLPFLNVEISLQNHLPLPKGCDVIEWTKTSKEMRMNCDHSTEKPIVLTPLDDVIMKQSTTSVITNKEISLLVFVY